MSVRSTQLRPSQQSRGAERAVAFAANASRRSESLTAATNRSSVSAVASPMVIANPNRTTRRWGTVAVTQTSVVRQTANGHAAATQKSRSAHPTAGSSAGSSRAGQSPRETVANQNSSGRSNRTDQPSRSNVVAMYPRGSEQAPSRQSPSPSRQSPSPSRLSPSPSRQSPSPSRQASSQQTPSPKQGSRSAKLERSGHVGQSARTHSSGTAGQRLAQHGTLRLGVVGPEVLGPEVVGATALAPQPQTQSYSRISKPKKAKVQADLRVARPPRQVRRRLLSRPSTTLFAIALVLGGAVSAIVLHADLAKNQLVLDKLRIEVGDQERTNQRLRVEVAELEAPARIINAANELGLVSSELVDYTLVDSTSITR